MFGSDGVQLLRRVAGAREYRDGSDRRLPLRSEHFPVEARGREIVTQHGVIIALAYLLAAITGMIGLKQNPLIEKASMFMSLALLLTVLLLLITFFARSRTGSTAGI